MPNIPARLRKRPRHLVARIACVLLLTTYGAPAGAQALSATPPMGWNPWNAFRTEVDEAKIVANAQLLVRSGLAEAGYRFVNIDDGWWLRREADGRIRIRTGIFPSAALPDGTTSFRPFVDRLHGMGLKAGIYTDIGRNNCAQHWDRDSPNLPAGEQREREVGTLGYQDADARLFFGEWGFDYAKVDACGIADYGPDSVGVRDGTYRSLSPLIARKAPARSEPAIVEALYARYARAIRTAAPGTLLEICAWGEAEVGNWAGRYAQLWRTSSDIRSNWGSMLANFDSAARRTLFAGPGRWNHPDMLEVGNGDFDVTHPVEARAHLSLWAIIAAPLILSLDLTRASPELIAILGNREVIAIDQDPAGHQGVILSHTAEADILVKPLARLGHKAVALVNRSTRPITLGVDLADLRLSPRGTTIVRDLWSKDVAALRGTRIERRLAPHETALLCIEGQAADPDTVFPDEMPAAIAVIDAGQAMPDRGRNWIPARLGFRPAGEPILRNGRPDTGTLGVASGSRVRITLAKRFRRVEIAPAGSSGTPYTIVADGRVVLRAKADGRSAIRLNTAGVDKLELQAPAGSTADAGFLWSDLRMIRR